MTTVPLYAIEDNLRNPQRLYALDDENLIQMYCRSVDKWDGEVSCATTLIFFAPVTIIATSE